MFSVEELVIQHRAQKVTVVNVKKRATATGRTDGMGILFMGYESVFCNKPPPWMRKQHKNSNDLGDDLDEDDPGSDLVSTGSNMLFSDAIQTILDTGAIRLIRSTSANTQTQLKEQLSVPMWVFNSNGPNVYYPQLENGTTDNDDIDDDSPTEGVLVKSPNRAPVPINKASSKQQALDLNRCRQFAIVRYEDLSDPKKSMLMIQTPEKESVHHLQSGVKIQAIEEVGSGDTDISSIQNGGGHVAESPLQNGDDYTHGVEPQIIQNGDVITVNNSPIMKDSPQLESNNTNDPSSQHFNTEEVAAVTDNSQAVVRAKKPDPNRIQLHFDSSPDSPLSPTDGPPLLTSPTISKYLQRDNPHMLITSIRERTQEPPSEYWEAEGGEFNAKVRPTAHGLVPGGGDSGVSLMSAKESKLKAKLADSALYRPSSGGAAGAGVIGNDAQLSLSHDMDSGIWDMIQGREGEQSSQASSRGSTPVIHLRADEPKHVAPLVSDIQELHIDAMIPSHPLEGAQGDKPSIAYRAFRVDAETNEVVLSKARLATYVPLLDKPKLAIEEEETLAIEDVNGGLPANVDLEDIIENESETGSVDDGESNFEAGPRISAVFEDDNETEHVTDTQSQPRISPIFENETEQTNNIQEQPQIYVLSESETETETEYQLAPVEAKLATVSESETDVFESAVENIERSDAALTDATPINEEWEFVPREQQSNDLGQQSNGIDQQSNSLDVFANDINDKTPTAQENDFIPSVRNTEQMDNNHSIEANDVVNNQVAGYMVSECTQTSPTHSNGDTIASNKTPPKVAPEKPVRRKSVSRQRSYAQAIVMSDDVTSPESESGWFTAQESMEHAAASVHKKVITKPRRKKSDGTRPKVTAVPRSQSGETDVVSSDLNSSDFAASTSDELISSPSTETSESPNTPTGGAIPVAQSDARVQSKTVVSNTEPVKKEHRKKELSNTSGIQSSVPTTAPAAKQKDYEVRSGGSVKEVKVEYDYPMRSRPGTLVSDVANVMNLNSKHKKNYTDASKHAQNNEDKTQNGSSVDKKPVRTHSGDGFDHSLYPWLKGSKATRTPAKAAKTPTKTTETVTKTPAKPLNQANNSLLAQSTPKVKRKSATGLLLKSAGADGKPRNTQNGDVTMRRQQSDDVDREERQLLSCGNEDYHHSDVAPNPFDPPVSPLLARRDRPGVVTRAGMATMNKEPGSPKRTLSPPPSPRKGGIMTRSSPPRDQEAVGLGLNQLQKAKVVTRTPVRPITMASRSGIGLNQLKSEPSGKKKPAFELSLLSPRGPGGSVSSSETSPAHSQSSRGSESPYFVASYNDGTEDWGDESLLWDADDDDDTDDVTYVTEDISALCDAQSFPDWMSELPERLHDVPLASLAIPGSHISLAVERDMKTDMDIAKSNYEMAEFLRKLPNLSIFNNFRSLIKQIWKAWMPKQMLNVTQQLNAGVRYLDVRVSKYRSCLYAEHGLYSKPLIRYLKQIKCYLDSHPKEVVIVQFEALNQIDTKDKRRLVTSLFQIFGARMAKVAGDMNKVTLNALWRRKKQIIIVFPEADLKLLHNHIFVGLIWPDHVITTQCPKAQTQDELRTFLDGTYYNTQAMRAKKETFQVTRAVLSPDMSMLFGEFEYESMRQLSLAETHRCVGKWLEHKTNINIVAFDFVGASGLIEQIIRLNDSKVAMKHTTVTTV